jgi:hypothetical protein
MSAARRALAVLPVAAVAIAASPAQGAEIKTLPCVPFVSNQQTMPIRLSGFTPGNTVMVYTNSPASPAPRLLATIRLDGTGGFQTVTLPPGFTRGDDDLESFNLIASDTTNPATPVVASFPFQVVRFGMTREPAPKRPSSRVTYTARGFEPGKRVYAHFRHGGKTRRTVSLGVARGVCGITSRKMRALPTTLRYGSWRAYIDQSKRFSTRTRPQWIDPFTITRVVG